MPKPPTRGVTERQGQPKLSATNLHYTRLVTQATVNGKPTNQQNPTEAITVKVQPKGASMTELNDVASASTERFMITSVTLLQPIIESAAMLLAQDQRNAAGV